MGSLTDVVASWAHDRWQEIDMEVHDDGITATLAFKDSNKADTYNGFIDTNEENAWARLFVYATYPVPELRRSVFTELLANINQRIPIGSFDLLEDGRFRFRTGVDVEEGTLAPKMIENMLYQGLGALDTYYSAFMGTIFAGLTAKQAIAGLDGETADAELNIWIPEGVENLPKLDQIAGSSVIANWATEVKTALASKEQADWSLVGPAIAIRHEDPDECAVLLQRVAIDNELRFVRIPKDAVQKLIPGLRRKFENLAPVLVYLEPDDWLYEINDDENDVDYRSALASSQYKLMRELKAFDAEHPVLIATSTDWLDRIESDLRQIGTFDRAFIIPPLDKVAIAHEFVGMLGESLCGDTIAASMLKLGALLKMNYEDRDERKLAALHLKRIAIRNQKRIEFDDVADMVIRGATEKSAEAKLPRPETIRRKTAIHEAGHAAIAILESNGANTPDYATIVPGRGFEGVVMESVNYADAGKTERTYADFRQKIRISLAGRVAEDLVFGPEQVSSGAQSDLENATRMALDGFGVWGFAPGMDKAGQSSSNLAVVVGKWSNLDYQAVYPLVRTFLADEYDAVKHHLEDNRALLEAIADRLMWDPLVDQNELVEICQKVGVECKPL